MQISENMKDWDLFISHAWEDKEEFVRPLAAALREHGLRVWYDEYTLRIGDSIRRGIEEGLSRSHFGLVVISPAFLKKEWPQKELDYLLSAETEAGQMILPIWHKVDSSLIRTRLPFLADRIALRSSQGLEEITGQITTVLKAHHSADTTTEHSQLIAISLYNALTVETKEVNHDIAQHSHPETSSLHKIFSGKTFLVVDDEPAVLLLISEMLEESGAKIYRAPDGTTALDKIEHTLERGDAIDVLISDIVMPGTNGVTLSKLTRKKWPHIGILLLSGYSNYDLKDVPHEFFLNKPFNTEKLLSAVTAVLNRSDDPLFISLRSLNPQTLAYYSRLLKHRAQIIQFLSSFSSLNLFETALRHKLKGIVHSFCHSTATSPRLEADIEFLDMGIRRLNTLMQHIENIHRLDETFSSIKHDNELLNPGIEININHERQVDFTEENIEKLLGIAAIELVDNAIDAIGDAPGTIDIVLKTARLNPTIILAVRNSGPKISLEMTETIFRDGFTSKGPGRGQGLAIIKRLAERFGGDLGLSQRNVVNFTLTIPIRAGRSSRPRA